MHVLYTFNWLKRSFMKIHAYNMHRILRKNRTCHKDGGPAMKIISTVEEPSINITCY